MTFAKLSISQLLLKDKGVVDIPEWLSQVYDDEVLCAIAAKKKETSKKSEDASPSEPLKGIILFVLFFRDFDKIKSTLFFFFRVLRRLPPHPNGQLHYWRILNQSGLLYGT